MVRKLTGAGWLPAGVLLLAGAGVASAGVAVGGRNGAHGGSNGSAESGAGWLQRVRGGANATSA